MNVLVIEDNENNMELISFILAAHQHVVLQACCGQDGIDMAREQRPELILLDIQLPDMSGLQVLQELRAMDFLSATPVIAVTSYAMTGDAKRLLDAGCDGYIEKPIDPGHIVEHIEQIIAQRRNS